MTVNTTESQAQFLGDGNTTQFSFSFLALEKDDLNVLLTNTTDQDVQGLTPGETKFQVRGSDYTLTLSDPGGTVDFSTSQAPATGLRVTLQRATDARQQIDYVENDPFPADTHERGLDRAALRDQELGDVQGLTLKYQPGDDQTVSTFLPLKEARADKLLGFNAGGTPVALSKLPDTQTVTSFAETLLDDADAQEARATLGVTGLSDIFGVTSGTASALTLSLNQGPALEEGTSLVIEPHTNVSADATLDYNSNGAAPLVVADNLNGGSDGKRKVNSGELAAGLRYQVNYDQADGQWQVTSGVAVGGVTRQDLARLGKANVFTAPQSVSAGTADDNNGLVVQGTFTDAHDFRLVQDVAKQLALKDKTTAKTVARYDGAANTLNVLSTLKAGGNRVLTEDENPWRPISRVRIGNNFAGQSSFDILFPTGFTYIRVWVARWSMDVEDEPFTRFLDSGGSLIPGTDGGGDPNYSTSTWNHRNGGNGSDGDKTRDRMYIARWNSNQINPPGSTIDGFMDITNYESTFGYTRIHGVHSSLEAGHTPLLPRQDMFAGCLRTDKFSPQEIGGIRIYAGTQNNATWQDGFIRVLGFEF